MIEWHWYRFDDFSAQQLYSVLAGRVAVFVVEQNCPYQELDNLDQSAFHLVGWSGDRVVSYLRLFPPGLKSVETSLGRVMTEKQQRRKGYGRTALEKALELIEIRYPNSPVRISAQAYLEGFYQEYGFKRCSEEFLEDGIPHIEMLRYVTQAPVSVGQPGNKD